MFQSRAQMRCVVYLCYQGRLFCISHSRSCSTNIINQKGKLHGLIHLHSDGKKKKILKSFLKKIWIKWIGSLCDKMVEARHFRDTWPCQMCGITDNTRMFLFTFQAWMACSNTRFPSSSTQLCKEHTLNWDGLLTLIYKIWSKFINAYFIIARLLNGFHQQESFLMAFRFKSAHFIINFMK